MLEDGLCWCILDWPSSEWIIFNETFLPTGTMGKGRFRKECPLGRVCGIWRGEKSVPRKVRKTVVFIRNNLCVHLKNLHSINLIKSRKVFHVIKYINNIIYIFIFMYSRLNCLTVKNIYTFNYQVFVKHLLLKV